MRVFRKINNVFGMKILWIFFWVIIKLDYIQESFLCILGSFHKVKVQNGGKNFRLVKFRIFFWGCLEFLIFLRGMVDAGPEPTYEEKMRVPPPPII